jgi:putative nucleotidyltransferase with HDIG domain
MTGSRAEIAGDVLRRFAAAMRSGQLYARSHPIIASNVAALGEALKRAHSLGPTITIGIVGDEVIVDDVPAPRGDNLSGFVRRLKHVGIERITIEQGVTPEELGTFIDAVVALEPVDDNSVPPLPDLAHIRVGRVRVDDTAETVSSDMATLKRMYQEAVALAETVWESARVESKPDAPAARSMVESLAQAISENRTALVALSTLRQHDQYTFTHMVNVSILTMSQARSLGVDGALLRELGLAALMHDIGKVRTPLEILNKPEALTPQEFAVLRRHPVDGASMLRATPDVPALAPIVAFEHHLRLDGTGYPNGVKRPSLNLGTMLCSIADVYDAMRSQRAYQQSFPSDRILQVLERNDGTQFDRHLVRRFARLIGIYPAGSVVRLDTGALAVVVTVHAPEPDRPHVRVMTDEEGVRLDSPRDVNLWEQTESSGGPRTIVSPVDSLDVDFDPLALLAQ